MNLPVTPEYQRRINGIACSFLPNPALHSFSLALFVRAGSVFEPEKENGITHLFEHTVFRNIKKKYGGKLYDRLAQSGLTFDASTCKEFMSFHIDGIPEGFGEAVRMISCIFDDIGIDGKEYLLEKKRIKSEILEDDEKSSLAGFADRTIWNGSGPSRIIIGTCGSLDAISLKKLNAFKNRILTKENIFFCVTGNVGKSDISAFEDMVGRLTIPESAEKHVNRMTVPEGFFRRKPEVLIKNSDYYSVSLSFDVNDEKFPIGVRDLLYTALFIAENSIVYTSLSEDRGLIYSYDSAFEEYDNIGAIKLRYEVFKQNLVESVRAAFGVFRTMKNGEFDFESTLRNQTAHYLMLQDQPSDLCGEIAYENHILSGAPIDFTAPLLGRYRGVTKEQVTEMAKEVFRPENLVIAVKGRKSFVSSLGLPSLIEELQ